MSTFSDVLIFVGSSGDSPMDGYTVTSEGIRDIAGTHAIRIHGSHLVNPLLGEGRKSMFCSAHRWTRTAPVLSALLNHVLNIIHLTSLEKMYRAVAGWIVATMQNIQAVLYRPIGYLERFPMNKQPSIPISIFQDLAVTIWEKAKWPFQARVGTPRQRWIIFQTNYGSDKEIDMTCEFLVVVRIEARPNSTEWCYPSFPQDNTIELFEGEPLRCVECSVVFDGAKSAAIARERKRHTWDIGPRFWRSFGQFQKFAKDVRFDNLGTAHCPALHWLPGWPLRCFNSAGPFLFYREVAA